MSPYTYTRGRQFQAQGCVIKTFTKQVIELLSAIQGCLCRWGRSHKAHLARRTMQRLTQPSNRLQVRGFLTIYSAPSALRHHIDWAIQSVLGNWIKLSWSQQSLVPGTFRTQLEFRDRAGASSEIASALASWHYLNFEVIESGEPLGEIFRFTPELGMHRAAIDQSGAALLSENQITQCLAKSFDEDSLRESIAKSLGTPWENQLERFRSADTLATAHLRAI
jgi:hypothetical protein